MIFAQIDSNLNAIKEKLQALGKQPPNGAKFYAICNGKALDRDFKALWNSCVMAMEEDRAYWKKIRSESAFEQAKTLIAS